MRVPVAQEWTFNWSFCNIIATYFISSYEQRTFVPEQIEQRPPPRQHRSPVPHTQPQPHTQPHTQSHTQPHTQPLPQSVDEPDNIQRQNTRQISVARSGITLTSVGERTESTILKLNDFFQSQSIFKYSCFDYSSFYLLRETSPN